MIDFVEFTNADNNKPVILNREKVVGLAIEERTRTSDQAKLDIALILVDGLQFGIPVTEPIAVVRNKLTRYD